MNQTIRSGLWPRIHQRYARCLIEGAGIGLLLICTVHLSAQSLDPHLWTAQTGWNEVTFLWDSIPGAAEYRIYMTDSNAQTPPDLTQRPLASLSANGRRARFTGIQRFVGRTIYLVALEKSQQVLFQSAFPAVVRATSVVPFTAPTGVQARETGAMQVTLSWNPVPGATAYMLGRAVGPSGLSRLCDLCPPTGQFVDENLTPGMETHYTVQAIFPTGISPRVRSNSVTPGVAQVASADGLAATGQTQTVPQPAPQPAPQPVPQPAAPMPPTNANATVQGVPAGAAWVTWQPSPTAGVTGYTLYRSVNGGAPSVIASLGANAFGHSDQAFPTTLFASGPVRASYYVVASISQAVSEKSNNTFQVEIQPPAGSTVTADQPSGGTPATPVLPSCKLDYKRADNMWAAFGRADGELGTETISLANGQSRVFVTDWKYEKQRSDGTNYYGSHLRIANNVGAGPVRLQIRTSWAATLKLMLSRLTGDTGLVLIEPGKSMSFQADLMEVHCGK